MSSNDKCYRRKFRKGRERVCLGLRQGRYFTLDGTKEVTFEQRIE